MANDPCVILLVEDDANDAFFVSRALKELGFNGTLQHLTDTEGARAYLSASAPFSERSRFPLPEIIVSDASLSPRGTGVELLEWMRGQDPVAEIPFVILSGDVSPEVRERARAAGVKAILRKGSSYQDTLKSLRDVLQHLPPSCRTWMKDPA